MFSAGGRDDVVVFVAGGPFAADTALAKAVGANGVIVGTRDGGDSWYVVQPAVTGNDLRAVERLSDTRAWAVGQLGTNKYFLWAQAVATLAK